MSHESRADSFLVVFLFVQARQSRALTTDAHLVRPRIQSV
jgi:hypothetical protein